MKNIANHTILFRAWDGMQMINNVVPIAKDKILELSNTKNIYNVISVEAINQFTGLYDVDDKAVYEGDILSIGNDELFFVEYFENRASFVMTGMETGKLRLFEDISSMKCSDFRIDVDLIKVVGNIYQDYK